MTADDPGADRKMLQRIIKYLSSLRLTCYVILALGAIFLLGLWIPQASVLQRELYTQWAQESPNLVRFLEALDLTEIYTSPITLALWGLFFLNLALVMWQRIPLIMSRVTFADKKLEDPRTATGYPVRASRTFPGTTDEARIAESLAGAGYKFYGTPERFYAVKNRFSPVATIFFHLSFFLMLIGGVISGYSKFAGFVDVAEGEAFHGELDRYNAPPRLPKIGTPPTAGFQVEKIVREVTAGVPTGLTVHLVDEKGSRQVAAINRPYKVGRTSYVISTIGVTPLFVLQDGAGNELDGAYVKLNVMGGKKDTFTIGGYRLSVLFYPDYGVEDGAEVTFSQEFKNPAFNLTVEKDGRVLARKTVRHREWIEFDGHRLLFRELPLWVRFFVVKEYGLDILYAGFVIAMLALIARLVFYRREMVGSLREENGEWTLFLAGRSEFYKKLSEDEFQGNAEAVFRKIAFRGPGSDELAE